RKSMSAGGNCHKFINRSSGFSHEIICHDRSGSIIKLCTGRQVANLARIKMPNPQATVLVVDDDPAITELMRDFLEAEGFAVEMASDARLALVIAERTPIDCLLLDVMMPGQSGFDLCRHIRETSDVPILFLSARDTDIDKIRGLGLG